ncbi:MAG: hypothetical protein K0U38_01215, partial [Epsilonproteobacteria bacterium]|nr:hypothetical protein [Campylobacterota bacterium]
QQDSQEIIKELGESGAGLSSFRRSLAKHFLFPLLNRLLSWEKAWDIYDKEGQKIIQLSSTLNQEQLFRRVLVPKLFGLEDNSRYYSVAMVIEHLFIVGSALQVRIPILSRGKKLNKHVKIEDVKPYKEIDEDVVKKFEIFLSTYREKLEKNIENIYIDNTSKHPWFGEFNPKQWSVLGVVHQIVHRRQIEAILKEIKASGKP